MNLSLAQSQIVNAPLGPILVTATAGSGKTRVLTERIRHLLSTRSNEGVLALTFTNKAASEMHTRLEGFRDLTERTFIGTIHSFAQDLIQRHGHHIGLKTMPHIFERDMDRLLILHGLVESDHFWAAEADEVVASDALHESRRKELHSLLDQISKSKRGLMTDDELVETFGEQALYLRNGYDEELRLQNAIDFDDLLVLAGRLLSEKPAVCRLLAQSYPHVCVDEAQDLNKAQYELVRSIGVAPTKSILLVGDPKQAIYGFNDSSSEFMTQRFVEDFKPQVFVLQENYRNSRLVIECANRIKPGSVQQTSPKNGALKFYEAPDEASEASWICDEIQTLLATGTHEDIEGDVTLESIAVLGRNRYVFQMLQEELERRDIRHFLKHPGGKLEFESETGKIFDLLLQVLINPKDHLHFRLLMAAIKSPPGAVSSEAFPSLVLNGQLRCDPQWMPLLRVALQSIQAELPSANSNPSMDRCIAPLRTLLQSSQLQDCALTVEERLLAVNDLKDLCEQWTRYLKQLSMGTRPTLDGFRNARAMGKTQADALEKGVALSTIHTAKGLEYEIVFLMGLGRGTFPDYRAERTGGKAMQEEDNNAFVAVTRAKRLLFLSYPQSKKMPWGDERSQQPSEYWTQLKPLDGKR